MTSTSSSIDIGSSSNSSNANATVNKKWFDKLQQNISKLTEASSKESIQTFVKWIYFNRKHVQPTFIQSIHQYVNDKMRTSGNSSVFIILLNILHEVFVLHYTTDLIKFESFYDVRIIFYESILMSYIQHFIVLNDTIKIKLKFDAYIEIWENYNVFNGPTYIRQIRTKVQQIEQQQLQRQESDVPSSSADVTATVASSSNDEIDTTAAATDSVIEEQQQEPQPHAPVHESITTTASLDTSQPIEDDHHDETVTAAGTVLSTYSTVQRSDTSTVNDPKTKTPINEETEKEVILLKVQEPEEKELEVVMVMSDKEMIENILLNSNDSNVQEEQERRGSSIKVGSINNTKGAASTMTVSSPNKVIEIDFESKGIPANANVVPQQFIDPCRLIATLQIARDLRNDSAVQLSAMLQNLPESVRTIIAEAAEHNDSNIIDGTRYELSDAKARELVPMVNDQLLDVDIQEQYNNVTTLIDLIHRQYDARQTMYELLVASRCNFGANDVAKTFYKYSSNSSNNHDPNSSNLAAILKQRAQILMDAMDLEGLEVQTIPAVSAISALEKDLVPFPWYNNMNVPSSQAAVVDVAPVIVPIDSTPSSSMTMQHDGNIQPSNKRQKIESPGQTF